MRRRILFMSIFAGMSVFAARAQSPAPIVVQAASNAASAATVSSTTSTPAAQNSEALQAALRSLQEMKVANEETLKKQEAALQQLDELQTAADQIKIFGKRG
jgi:guanyl-specific ribonuclease Sa